MDTHIRSKHPKFKGEGSLLLDNIEFYYHSIKNLPELDEKIQPFVDAVKNEIANSNCNEEPLPGRQLQEWLDMEDSIKKVKARKACRRNFFCNICGKIVMIKSNAVRHVQKFHIASHSNGQQDHVSLLQDVSVYYDTIKDLPDLDVSARRFVDKVNNEMARAKRRSASSSDAGWIQTKKHLYMMFHFDRFDCFLM